LAESGESGKRPLADVVVPRLLLLMLSCALATVTALPGAPVGVAVGLSIRGCWEARVVRLSWG
jgi:hypothetical protein